MTFLKSRMTQIMAMLNLAADIQEEILFLLGTTYVKERNIRAIAGTIDWKTQRKMWQNFLRGLVPIKEKP